MRGAGLTDISQAETREDKKRILLAVLPIGRRRLRGCFGRVDPHPLWVISRGPKSMKWAMPISLGGPTSGPDRSAGGMGGPQQSLTCIYGLAELRLINIVHAIVDVAGRLSSELC